MKNFVIVLFGLTMIHVSSTSRIEAYVKTLAMQGILLFTMVVVDNKDYFGLNFLFLVIETLVFKAIIIPWFLMKIIRKNEIFREIEPNIPAFWSIVISSLIFGFGFMLSYLSIILAQDVNPLYFGISISTMITGLFIIITRKKIITHIMGYMMLENGIFLLTLSLINEMPLIVSLGVLLDVFIGIYLFGLFFNKIQATYEKTHIDTLTYLKD